MAHAKTVVITGASGGIGTAVAARVGQAGSSHRARRRGVKTSCISARPARVLRSGRVSIALVAVAVASHACGGTTTGPSRISPGLWGGDHIAMSVVQAGAHLELDCAHGDIPAVPTLDRQGQFDVAGTYTREHGGPIRQGEIPDTHPAVYSGLVSSTTMTLTIRLSDTSEAVGTFMLVSGSAGRVFKCL